MKKMISAISLIGLLALTSCAHHGKNVKVLVKKNRNVVKKSPVKMVSAKKAWTKTRKNR